MPTIPPAEAALLADAVYGIRTIDNVEQGVNERPGGADVAKLWDLASGTSHQGVSGNVVTQKSGFAMVLKGRTDGKYAGETLVAARGTQTTQDWLSNATTGVSPGPYGTGVHTGFNRIYKSFIDKVMPLVPDSGQIHVIGHSLGGAIANLIAAKLSSSGERSIKLYTFGSPRVGLPPTCMRLQKQVGKDNIYRVYNLADPVPMVPIYPFIHTPWNEDGIRVGGSAGLVSIDAHLMPKSYIPLTAANNSWTGLRRAGEGMVNLRRVDELLEEAGKHVSIPGGSWALWALGKALQALIDFAILKLGIKVMVYATAIDTVAQILVHAATIAKELGKRLLRLIELALSWTGRVVRAGTEVTAAFLSYVLQLLLKPISIMASRALSFIG